MRPMCQRASPEHATNALAASPLRRQALCGPQLCHATFLHAQLQRPDPIRPSQASIAPLGLRLCPAETVERSHLHCQGMCNRSGTLHSSRDMGSCGRLTPPQLLLAVYVLCPVMLLRSSCCYQSICNLKALLHPHLPL